jgi:hypothetical protein
MRGPSLLGSTRCPRTRIRPRLSLKTQELFLRRRPSALSSSDAPAPISAAAASDPMIESTRPSIPETVTQPVAPVSTPSGTSRAIPLPGAAATTVDTQVPAPSIAPAATDPDDLTIPPFLRRPFHVPRLPRPAAKKPCRVRSSPMVNGALSMIDQLPEQGGGQLLPLKGSIDRPPPACSRNAPTAAPAGRSEHHQTLARPRTDFPFRLPVQVTPPETRAAPTKKQERVLWSCLVFPHNI